MGGRRERAVVATGATVGHMSILYAAFRVLPDGVVGDRCTPPFSTH